MKHPLLNELRRHSPELLALLMTAGALLLPAEEGVLHIILCVAAYLILAFMIVSRAESGWATRIDAVRSTLVVIASIGAFFVGQPAAAVSMIFFYWLCIRIGRRLVDKVKRTLDSSREMCPDELTTEEEDGTTHPLAADHIHTGDTVIGTKEHPLSINGILISPSKASFDFHNLTGEHKPVEIKEGEYVPAGAIPLDDEIKVKVTKEWNENSIADISNFVREAASNLSPSRLWINRIATFFSYFFFVGALLAFFLPTLLAIHSGLSPDWIVWARRALIIFVCAGTAAPVISLQIAHLRTIRNARQMGIIFHDTTAIETLPMCDTMLFDKTGTLTSGILEVIKTAPTRGHVKEEVVGLAALATDSSHPLGRALTRYSTIRLPQIFVTDKTVTPKGIRCQTNKGEILAGMRSFMNDNGIDVSRLAPADDTEICIALNNEFFGQIFFADILKTNSASAIARLRRLGIKSIGILSDDNERSVARISKLAGADYHKSTMLPDDKARLIKKILSTGRKVAFVSDGISSPQANEAATIAIGLGTARFDLQEIMSDISILSHNPDRLADTVQLARRLRLTIRLSLFLGILGKLAISVLGLFGFISLLGATCANFLIILLMLFSNYFVSSKASGC